MLQGKSFDEREQTGKEKLKSITDFALPALDVYSRTYGAPYRIAMGGAGGTVQGVADILKGEVSLKNIPSHMATRQAEGALSQKHTIGSAVFPENETAQMLTDMGVSLAMMFAPKASEYFKDKKQLKVNKRELAKILGIDENATSKEVKTAYSKWLVKNHPDKFINIGEEKAKEAEELFKKVYELNQFVEKEVPLYKPSPNKFEITSPPQPPTTEPIVSQNPVSAGNELVVYGQENPLLTKILAPIRDKTGIDKILQPDTASSSQANLIPTTSLDVSQPLVDINKRMAQSVNPFISKYGLTDYSAADYSNFQVGITPNNTVGYAVKPDGELISVFNNGGKKGDGAFAVIDAIESGATKLDCFDGDLVDYYEQFGFKEVGRDSWNDKYAPANWNYKKYGKPDIVYMQLDKGQYENSPKVAEIKQVFGQTGTPVFHRSNEPNRQGDIGTKTISTQKSSTEQTKLEDLYHKESQSPVGFDETPPSDYSLPTTSPSSVKEILKPKSTAQKAFESLAVPSKEVLAKSGSGGEKAAKLIDTVEESIDLTAGDYIARMKSHIDKLNAQEKLSFADVVEGKQKPISEAQKLAVQEWKSIRTNTHNRAANIEGLDVGFIEDYFPHYTIKEGGALSLEPVCRYNCLTPNRNTKVILSKMRQMGQLKNRDNFFLFPV